MRPQDYQGLLDQVRRHRASLEVVRGRLSVDGALPAALDGALRARETDLIPLLLGDRHADARTAAIEVWEWLESGRLAEVDVPIALRPGDTIPPESLERVIRVELQRAKAPAHLGRLSRRNLQTLHAVLRTFVEG